jgi:hypothetical protein
MATVTSNMPCRKAGMDPRTSARGVANVDFVEEVGGGLNLKRPKFVTIMDRIKNRLVRFEFPWFEVSAPSTPPNCSTTNN